jgi:hypothetical protein
LTAERILERSARLRDRWRRFSRILFSADLIFAIVFSL